MKRLIYVPSPITNIGVALREPLAVPPHHQTNHVLDHDIPRIPWDKSTCRTQHFLPMLRPSSRKRRMRSRIAIAPGIANGAVDNIIL